MEKKNYSKICPSCRSKDIRFEATDAGIFDICKKCGFRMNSFPEVEQSKKVKSFAKYGK